MRVVSIIVPIYNEAVHIDECVRSCINQQGEGFAVEVLVVDGMSTDKTREIVGSLAGQNSNIRLLDNPKRTVPFAMNIGIEASQGEVIVLLGGHAAMAPDFVAQSLNELDAHPDCGCVGGIIENIDENAAAKVISLAMGSRFGVGNAHFRTGSFEGYVDTVAFGAYRKEVFDQIGLFDTALTRNQDDELNFRLTQSGWKIWLSKAIRSRYYVRGSFARLWRQYFQYGYWKVYVNRKHKAVTTVRQLVPFAFVGYVVGWLLLDLVLMLMWSYPFPVFWLHGPILYASAAFAFASRAGKGRNTGSIARAFAIMHVGYGLGYWLGIIHFLVLRKQPSAKQEVLSR